MPNLIQRAALWFDARKKSAGGRTITYRRSSALSVALTATPHSYMRRVVGDDGMTVLVKSLSFSFQASELIFGGSQVEPREGDVIDETLNGATVRYEVVPPEERKPCFEFLDSSELLLLVYVKRIKYGSATDPI